MMMLCVFQEMETVDGEMEKVKGCSDVVKEALLLNETEPNMSEAIETSCDNPGLPDANNEDLSSPGVEHFNSLDDAAFGSTAVNDAVPVELNETSEVDSQNHSDEKLRGDYSKEHLSTPDLEAIHNSSEAACGGTTVDDVAASSYSVDTTSASETQPKHFSGENVPSDRMDYDASMSAETVSSNVDNLEDRSEAADIDEPQSVAATSEDNDNWMYVLGHDQLKKRACTPAIFCFFLCF